MKYYSYLNAFTGLMRDALYDCKKTVIITTKDAMANPIRKIHHSILTLKAGKVIEPFIHYN